MFPSAQVKLSITNCFQRFLLVFLLLNGLNTLHAQSVNWSVPMQSEWNDYLYGAVKDKDNNVYVCGRIGKINSRFPGYNVPVIGWSDAVVAKINTQHEVEWVVNFGDKIPMGQNLDVETDQAFNISYLPEQDLLVVTGFLQSDDTTLQCGPKYLNRKKQMAYMLGLGTNGECKWSKGIYDLGVWNNPPRMGLTTTSMFQAFYSLDGAVIVPENIVFRNKGTDIVQLDYDGNVLRHLAFENFTLNAAKGKLANKVVFVGSYDKDVVVNGVTYPLNGAYGHGCVLVLNETGAVDFFKPFLSTLGAEIMEASLDSVGNMLITADFYKNAVIGTDTLQADQHGRFIAKLSPTGVVLWYYQLSGSIDANRDGRLTQSQPLDGTYFIFDRYEGINQFGPYSVGTTSSSSGAFLMQLTTDGEFLNFWSWENIFEIGDLLVNPNEVILTLGYAGTLEMGGNFYSANPNNVTDAMVVSLQIPTSTGIVKREEPLPLQLAANPSAGICVLTIPSALKSVNSLTLQVYTMGGKLLREIPINTQNPQQELNLSTLAKSTYQVVLIGNGQRYSSLLVLQ